MLSPIHVAFEVFVAVFVATSLIIGAIMWGTSVPKK